MDSSSDSSGSDLSDDSSSLNSMSDASDFSDLDYGTDIDLDEGELPRDQSAGRVRLEFTEVGSYTSSCEAKLALEGLNTFSYTYDTRYKTDSRYVRVFRCRSHISCGHRAKIATDFGGDVVVYLLLEGGHHARDQAAYVRRGIDPALRSEVDVHLRMGWGADGLRGMLMQRYDNQPDMLAIIPTTRQLENRKAYLVRTSPGGWDLRDYSRFNAWASERLVNTREKFFEVSSSADPRMDDMIILDSFVIDGAEGDEPASFGVVVTSRRVFNNTATSVRDQQSQLVCATDGTYKLHFGGWTVVDCGSETVVWSRNDFVHRFIPWIYMFVRSESTEAYTRMFTTIRDRAQTFFGISVEVAFGSLDHSEAIASAFLQTWPRVKLLTCFPHLARQARKKRALLSDPDLYESLIKPQLRMLKSARTHKQFVKISAIVVANWTEIGEGDYARWFKEVYLTPRWHRWYANGAGIPGVVPSQQGIESHHRVIKTTCAPRTHASTSGVLEGIIPQILRSDGVSLCPSVVAHLCEGPVPPDLLLKAQRLLASSQNYRRIYKGRGQQKKLVSILFNTALHLNDGANILAVAVDQHRARRFMNSLEGHIADDVGAAEIQYELLSLHRVKLTGPTPSQQFKLTPVWSMTLISQVRASFRCTCEAHVRSGWVCSHVLATLALLGLLDVATAVSLVPVRRAPGRPSRRRQALAIEPDEDGFFDAAHLTRLFLRRPGRPLGWKVIDDFDINYDGEIESSAFVGAVVSNRLSDGVFVWTARFDRDDMRDYTADALADVVRRARAMGVNVTG